METNNRATTDQSQNVLSCSANNKKLLFRVLHVTLYGEKRSMDIYALFDDGSSITMLDKEIADYVGIKGKTNNLNIQWFGGQSAKEPSMTFNIKISGVDKKKIHLLKHAVSNLNLPTQSQRNKGNICKFFPNSHEGLYKYYTEIIDWFGPR